jgi:hypothetical protein
MDITSSYFGTGLALCKAIQRVPIFGSGTSVELGKPLSESHHHLPFHNSHHPRHRGMPRGILEKRIAQGPEKSAGKK